MSPLQQKARQINKKICNKLDIVVNLEDNHIDSDLDDKEQKSESDQNSDVEVEIASVLADAGGGAPIKVSYFKLHFTILSSIFKF